ncbi:hypothetical protein QEN19_001289 [Hanseniaspora menglaensis]
MTLYNASNDLDLLMSSSQSEQFIRSLLEGNPHSLKFFQDSLHVLAADKNFAKNNINLTNHGNNFNKWWIFLQGLAIGQVTVLLIFVFFIKFFIFSEEKTPDPRSHSDSILTKLSNSTSIIKLGGKERLINENLEDEIDMKKQLYSLLEKTCYDVDTHKPESLDWFNVLIAQAIQQLRLEALLKDNIVHSLNDFIDRKSKDLPPFIRYIKIKELDIGDNFPIFSNCKIQYSPNSSNKRLEATIDINLNDRLAFGVETQLALNFPKPLSGTLPIELTVSMVKFQASLTVSLTTGEEFANAYDGSPHVKDDMGGYFLMFSFSPEYTMDFEIESLIGSTTKLENIPKISDIIQYQIKKWFVERCVSPRFQFTRLPNVWPRTKNTGETKASESDDILLSKGNSNK